MTVSEIGLVSPSRVKGSDVLYGLGRGLEPGVNDGCGRDWAEWRMASDGCAMAMYECQWARVRRVSNDLASF